MTDLQAGGFDASLNDLSTNGTAPPEPHTFDLAAFIAETATYATYTYTVYLAAEQARRSVELAERITKLRAELDAVHRDNERNPTSSASLGEVDPGTLRARQLSDTLAELTRERAPLVQQVKASALTFTFSCTGRDMQKDLLDKIQDVMAELEDNPDADAATPQRMIEQTALLMAEMTSKITNARGQTYPRDKITADLLRDLLNRLSISDISRLSQTMALTLTGAQDYDRAIDAGFPG